MNGESNLSKILQNLHPELNEGEYVFITSEEQVPISEVICLFREKEGKTYVLKKEIADKYDLQYSFIAAWITLMIHSSLDSVGLTATFSNALSEENISCNVIAAYYHDHIFVSKKDATKAMNILKNLSER